MSADLLAEFDTFYQATPPSNDTQHPTVPQGQTLPPHGAFLPTNTRNEFDDIRHKTSLHPPGPSYDFNQTQSSITGNKHDWARFEHTTSPNGTITQSGSPTTTQSVPSRTVLSGLNARHDTYESPSKTQWGSNSAFRTQQSGHTSQKFQRPHRDDNILFDAEEDQEDDDFGDFELAQSTTTDIHPSQTFDSLSHRKPKESLLNTNRFNFDDLNSQNRAASVIPNSSSNLSASTERSWLEDPSLQSERTTSQFDNLQSEPKQNTDVNTFTSLPMRFDAFPNQSDHNSSDVPPTNIPPPAILLTMFPPLLGLAHTKLLEPLNKPSNTLSTREAIIAHPETQTFIASYLAIISVLARINAGRKLRWKRDTILAQSMRIGPASASGRSGGMKLAGIDKTENAREDRELNDVLGLWRAQLGRLRSIIAIAGSHFHIPEVTESAVVRTVKEDGLTAPKPCVLCGLKRNERVVKVDLDIQDSFGEWWVEHWGHRSCKSFWDAHKSQLGNG